MGSRFAIHSSQWGRLCLSFPVSAGSPQGSESPFNGDPACSPTPCFSLGDPRPLQRLWHGPRSRAAVLQLGPQAAASPDLAARSLQALRWPEPAAASAPPGRPGVLYAAPQPPRSRSPPGRWSSPHSPPPAAATHGPSPAAASTSSGRPRAAPRPRGRPRP